MTLGLRDEDLAEIRNALHQFKQIDSALIFGSRATGKHRPGSDVDIAITGDEVDFTVVAKLHWQLEENSRMPYLFDIVDYTHLQHNGLKEHIERVGVSIYTREQS